MPPEPPPLGRQEFFQTVRDKCFEKCITRPGTSMSKSELTCMSNCCDRYIDVRHGARALSCAVFWTLRAGGVASLTPRELFSACRRRRWSQRPPCRSISRLHRPTAALVVAFSSTRPDPRRVVVIANTREQAEAGADNGATTVIIVAWSSQ